MPSLPSKTSRTPTTMPSSSLETKFEEFQCTCGSSGCCYRYAEDNFNDDKAKSVEELNEKMASLFQNIWTASYTRELTPCILDAVRACIEACKRTEASDKCLGKFYDLRLDGNSLPASIILHSVLDTSKADLQHTLIQMILDAVPLTTAARDELCIACAKADSNVFFNQIQASASLSQLKLQAFPVDKNHSDIGKSLRSRLGFVESVQVNVTSSTRFQIMWTIPDVLQAIRSRVPFCTEFVARGCIWGAYFGAVGSSEIGFKIRILKSSGNKKDIDANIHGKLIVSPSRPGQNSNKVLSFLSSHTRIPNNTIQLHFRRLSGMYQYADNLTCSWEFQYVCDKLAFYRNVNEDGSCYLKFNVKIIPIKLIL